MPLGFIQIRFNAYKSCPNFYPRPFEVIQSLIHALNNHPRLYLSVEIIQGIIHASRSYPNVYPRLKKDVKGLIRALISPPRPYPCVLRLSKALSMLLALI